MAGSPGTIAAGSPFQQIWRRSETMSVIRSLLAELAPGAFVRRRPVMAEPSGKPDTRQPGSPRKKRDEATASPSTSSASQPDDQPLRNSLANRNPGPRQDGMTQRPTDEQID